MKYDIKVDDKFGRWTVLEINTVNPDSKAKNPPKMAKCQCECGTIRYKEYRDLYSGRSQSCGCYRAEKLSIRNQNNNSVKIGDRYGKLVVIEFLGLREQSRGRKEQWAKCICDCGNTTEVSTNNLQSGGTKSCGCLSSHGEFLIKKLLLENNINFCSQYTFSDLKDKGLLRFDFAIFKEDKLYELIEFQGRQHYTGPEASWSHSDSLEDIQRRDSLKKKYCEENNIKLICIPYTEINNITLKLLNL